MAESPRGGLSLGLSGFGFWSHDIGGFEGLPPAPLYKRWVAFGMLSSHSRLHGSSSYRVPWLYDDEAVDTLRFFTKLKCRLMPYLYAAAAEASNHGTPMMRAMLLEFPEDPTAAVADRQYMLGERLLVAPVFSGTNVVQYYVPAGEWTSVIDGTVRTGPGWFTETHGFLSLPLLARPNSVIAWGAVDDRPDYDYANRPEFEVYALQDRQTATATIVDLAGAPVGEFRADRTEDQILLTVTGAIRGWSAVLVGVQRIDRLTGGQSKAGLRGIEIVADEGSNRVSLQILPR